MTDGAKSTTRRKRRLINRGGRPRLTSVERSRSGRLTRAEQRRRAAKRAGETVQVAVSARQRHLDLSDADARDPEAPVVAWRWWKRGEIQELHYSTAIALNALHGDYLKAIKCPGLTVEPGNNMLAPGDPEGIDPDYVAWCNRKRACWLALRRDLLAAGPLTLLAAQSVAIENRDMVSLIPDFREAMNIARRRLAFG